MSRAFDDLQIREAVPDDAEQLVGILNSIIDAGTFTALDTLITIDEERDYIASFPQRGVLLVAIRVSEQRIVGCQSVEPFATGTSAFDHVGVMGTFVDLGQRRQGIARRLFAASFERCVQIGYEKLFTYVRADNSAALATYLNQGFLIVGTARRHAKIRGRYVDEVLIERFLQDSQIHRNSSISPM